MSPSQPSFGVIRMRGGRYEQRGLPLAGAEELRRYERLVVRTARALYMREHRKRTRAPRGFSSQILLRLTEIETGSVMPVLERALPETHDDLVPVEDYFESARVLINSALRSLDSTDGKLDPQFPVECLKEFANFGRSLQPSESYEFSDDASDTSPAIFNKSARRKLQALAKLEKIETELVVQGQVTGLRSTPQQFDFLLSGTDKKLICDYGDSAIWDDLREFQGFNERAPMVSLSVVAEQSLDGEVLAITDVLLVEAALPPEWAKRIEELSELRSGWLFAESPAPTRESIDAAEQFLLACFDEEIARPGIYPTPDGGIQLEWSQSSLEVEVEFLPNGRARGLWVSKADDDRGGEADFEIDDLEGIIAFVYGGLSD